MQSSHWNSLLKKLPPEAHNQLSVVTKTGAEIVVQSLLQLDGECLIIKGRIAASQDSGRLYFVPFDQIDYVGFYRSVSEEEYRTWFGETPSPAVTNESLSEQSTPTNGTSSRSPTPSRAALLERVRARTTSPGLNLNGISLPVPPPTST